MFFLESLKMIIGQISEWIFSAMMWVDKIFGYGWTFDRPNIDKTPWFLDLIISIWIPLVTLTIFFVMIKRSVSLAARIMRAMKNLLRRK